MALPRFQITSPELPNVIFFDIATINDDVHQAIVERDAMDNFEVDGCEPALWEALLGLCWSYDSIQEYIDATPTNRLAMRKVGYGFPLNFAMAA